MYVSCVLWCMCDTPWQVLRLLEGLLVAETAEALECVRRASIGGLSDDMAAGCGGGASETASVMSETFGFYTSSTTAAAVASANNNQDDGASDTNSVQQIYPKHPSPTPPPPHSFALCVS